MRTRPWVKRTLVELRRLVLLFIGTLLVVAAYVIFQLPHDLAAGGVSGLGILVNHYTGWPVGTFYLAANIPLFILGFFQLGGWRFLFNTMLSVVIFSVGSDLAVLYLPRFIGQAPITTDVLLSAIYAGLIGGVGTGFVFAAGATLGGTDILGRIIQLRTGIPLSQVYLWTDGAIVLSAGLIFGWEIALYAVLTLLLFGLAADYVLEGPSRARTAIIITTRRDAMLKALMERLERGVSYWEATGGYTGEERCVLMCAIYRPQVNALKQIVAEVDPDAFVSIGMAQDVLGEGFSRLDAPI